MSLAQPIAMSTDAWRAIGTEVLEPAMETATPPDVPALAALLGAWRDARSTGGSTTVFLAPEHAMVLAQLLDARPELAAGLG